MKPQNRPVERREPDRPVSNGGYTASIPAAWLTMRNGRVVEPGDEDDDRYVDGWAFPLDGDDKSRDNE